MKSNLSLETRLALTISLHNGYFANSKDKQTLLSIGQIGTGMPEANLIGERLDKCLQIVDDLVARNHAR